MTSSGTKGDKRGAWLIDQLTKSEFFHQKLHEYGLLEIARAIEDVRGESLDWNLADLGISEEAWNKVIHRGIKPVRVFAHPNVLMTVQRSVGYYRQLAMVSLKSMHNIGLRVERFEMGTELEEMQMAYAISQRLNELVSRLIESDEREFDLWRGMAAGSQAQGSWQNQKGKVAEELVKRLIQRRIRAQQLLVSEDADRAMMQLSDGRTVQYGSEPDIALYDADEKILTAIEIKGGIDTAGVLERIGAAIKSLSRAKHENPEALTALIMYGVSMTDQARSELEAHRGEIDFWFTIENVLNREVTQEQIFALLSV